MANIPGLILSTAIKSSSKKQFIDTSKKIYKIANSKGRIYNTDFYYKRAAYLKERDAKIFKNRLSIAKEILSIKAHRHPFTNFKKLSRINSYIKTNKELKKIDGISSLVDEYIKKFKVTNFDRRLVENFSSREDGFSAGDIKKSDSMRHYFNFQATTVKTEVINTKDVVFLNNISKEQSFTKDDVLNHFKNKPRFNEADYFSTKRRIDELCDKELIKYDGKTYTYDPKILENPLEVNSLNDMVIYYFSQNNRINFEDMKNMHDSLEYKFASFGEFKSNVFEATSKLCDDGFLSKDGFTYSLTQAGKEYFESANKHVLETSMEYIKSKMDLYTDLDLLVKVDQRYFFSEKFMKIIEEDKKDRLGHNLNFDSTHKEILMKIIETPSIADVERYFDLKSTSNLKRASYTVKLDELIESRLVGRGKNDTLFITDIGYESLKIKRDSPLSFALSDMQFFRIQEGSFTFDEFKNYFSDENQFLMSKQRLFKLVDSNIFKLDGDKFIPTQYGHDLKRDFEIRLKEVNYARRFNTFDIDELKHNIFKTALENKSDVTTDNLMRSPVVRDIAIKQGHAREPFEMNDLDAVQIRNMFIKYNPQNTINEYLSNNLFDNFESLIVISKLNEYLEENLNKGRFNAYILRDKLAEIMSIAKDDERINNQSEWFAQLKKAVYQNDYFEYVTCDTKPTDYFTDKRFNKLIQYGFIETLPDGKYSLSDSFVATYETYVKTFSLKKKEIVLLNECMTSTIDVASAIKDGKVVEGRVKRLIDEGYIKVDSITGQILPTSKAVKKVDRKISTILSLHIEDLTKFNYLDNGQISDKFVANYFSKSSFKKDKLHERVLKKVTYNKNADMELILNTVKFDVNKEVNLKTAHQKVNDLIRLGYLNSKDVDGKEIFSINKYKFDQLLKPKEIIDLMTLNNRTLLSFDDIKTLDMIFKSGRISDRNINLYSDMLEKLKDNGYLIQDKNNFSFTAKFNKEYARLIGADIDISAVRNIEESINHVVGQHYYNAELKSCFYSDVDIKSLIQNLNYGPNDIVRSVSNEYFKIEKDVGFPIGVSNHRETQMLRVIVDRDGNLKSAYPINTLSKDFYKSFSDIKLNMYDYNNILMHAKNDVLNLSQLDISFKEMVKIKNRVNNLEAAGYLEYVAINEYKVKEHFKTYIDDIRKIKDGELSNSQIEIFKDLSRFYNITHNQINDHLIGHGPQLNYNIDKLLGKELIDVSSVMIDGRKESVYTLTSKGIKFVEKHELIDREKTFKSKLHSRPEELKHDLYVYSAYKHFEKTIEKEGGKIISSLTDKDMRSLDMKTHGEQRLEYSDIYIEYELSSGERHFANIEVDCGYDRETISSKALNIDNLIWYTNTGDQAAKIEKVLSKPLVFTITL